MPYDNGRFVWFECITKDIEKAKAFYTEVLNWKVEPMEMAGGKTYDLLKCGEAAVGGFMEPMMDGVPSHWMSYVSVQDVDQSVTAVEKAGGKRLTDPFDVPGVGRIGPVQDPQGGGFCLFRAESGDPDAPEGAGSFHWNELWTGDAGRSLGFYEKVLGYGVDEMQMPQGTYHVLKTGDRPRGGILKSPAGDVPAHWLPFVHVDDCDDTVARAKKRGATVTAEPQSIPQVGRFAVLRDPVGAAIGVITPAS